MIDNQIYNVASEIYLNILITDNCNCPFCIANLNCEKLEGNVDKYKDKIDFSMKNFNVKDIVFVGGEPTFSSEEVTRLMDIFENETKLIERNDKVFGTIPYSLVLYNDQQVLLNYLRLEDN